MTLGEPKPVLINSCSTSDEVTTYVPRCETAIPAAIFANIAASNKLSCLDNATVKAASTVSPAPETSNTSRANVGNSIGSLLASIINIPLSPRVTRRDPIEYLGSRSAKFVRYVSFSKSSPKSILNSRLFGFNTVAPR